MGQLPGTLEVDLQRRGLGRCPSSLAPVLSVSLMLNTSDCWASSVQTAVSEQGSARLPFGPKAEFYLNPANLILFVWNDHYFCYQKRKRKKCCPVAC